MTNRNTIPTAIIPIQYTNRAEPAMQISEFGGVNFGKSNFSNVTPAQSERAVDFSNLVARFGLKKAMKLYEQYGTRVLVPSGQLGGIAEMVESQTAKTVGFFADISVFILLMTALWFIFPIMKTLRPKIAERLK